MFNHRMGINKTTLRDHIKKRMTIAGDSFSTTKPTFQIIRKVAQMIGIILLNYGSPAFKYSVVTAPPVSIATSAPMVPQLYQ